MLICLAHNQQTHFNINLQENSAIYQDVFNCIPNDNIHSRYDGDDLPFPNWSRFYVLCLIRHSACRAALRQSIGQCKEKIGHNTIDLGIAPKKIEIRKDETDAATDPLERLSSVKGHLVSFPLDFMCQEDLRPMLIESEFYASPQVFH